MTKNSGPAWRNHLGVGLGIAMIAASPLVGVLPGPGGVVLLALGLGLTLRSSRYARKHYVRFRRKWPRYGEWTDRALRTARRKRLRRQMMSEKNEPE